jgi:hypothetical protein
MWSESREEAHTISQENWDCPNRVSSKDFVTINCIHTATHIRFRMIALYGWNIANGCDINALRMNSFYVDEVYYTREGVFTVHNSHLWTLDNPHAIRERGYQVLFSVSFGLEPSGTLVRALCRVCLQMCFQV